MTSTITHEELPTAKFHAGDGLVYDGVKFFRHDPIGGVVPLLHNAEIVAKRLTTTLAQLQTAREVMGIAGTYLKCGQISATKYVLDNWLAQNAKPVTAGEGETE